MAKDGTRSAVLYQDIIDRIIDLSFDDFHSLTSLCRVSRACAQIVRKLLYKELDLKPPSPFFPNSQHPSLELKAKRRQAILDHDHLWKYVRSLTISVGIGHHPGAYTYTSVLPWISIAVGMKTHIERVNLSVSGRVGSWENFPQYKEKHAIRVQVEEILGSPSLKSVFVAFSAPSTLTGHTSPSTPPFPTWIFQCLSPSITRVHISNLSGGWNDLIGSPSTRIPDAIPLTTRSGRAEQREQWYLRELSLMINPFQSHETMDLWVARITGPCFRLNLSGIKKLSIGYYSPGEESFWKIAEEASKSLEELTIVGPYHPYPCRSTVPLRQNLFAQFGILHTLSFEGLWPEYTENTSLMEILSLRLPSSLRRVVIDIRLGESGDDPYAVPQHFKSDGNDLSCWSELDEVLNGHRSLASIVVHLGWSTPRKPPILEDQLSETDYALCERRQEKERKMQMWKNDLTEYLVQWRELFAHVDKRGILDIRYTCSEV